MGFFQTSTKSLKRALDIYPYLFPFYVIIRLWLFIPFGVGMYRIDQKKSIFLAALLFSILIEATQYVTGLGVAEFNDVFENTMGGMIGSVLASILIRQIKK